MNKYNKRRVYSRSVRMFQKRRLFLRLIIKMAYISGIYVSKEPDT